MNDGYYCVRISYDSIKNIISNNYIKGLVGVKGLNQYGIKISAEDNAIVDNNITTSQYGVWLGGSENNLTNNRICNNTHYDIYLTSDSTGNTGDNVCDKLRDDDSNQVTCSQSCSAPQPTCITPTDGMLINESVVLCPGVYNLPNGIKINADNIEVICNGTVLNGTGSGNGIENNGYDNVTVRNCKIENYERGIYWHDGADNGKIENNTANSNNYYGIYLSSSSKNILSDNIATSNNWDGIYLKSSSSNILTDNTATSNNRNGIFLRSSSNNTLTNNTIQENSYYDIYVYATSDSHCNNNITNNIGSGNRPILYYNISISLSNNNISELILCNADNSNINNITVSGSDTLDNNGILLVRTDHTNIANSNSSNNINGIYLDSGSNNNILINNTANSNNKNGIYLYSSSSNNSLTNNIANFNNNYGIRLDSGSSNILTDNTANSNYYEGIRLSGSSNTLTNNTATHNGNGIGLASGSSNTLTDNTVSNNSQHGIYLNSNSINNNFTNTRACFNNQSGGAYYDLYDLTSNGNFWSDSTYDTDNKNNATYFDKIAGCLGPVCVDNDGDGYGVCPNCNITNGCTYDGHDCDDTDALINPGATENCTNSLDDDCDGLTDCDDPDCYGDPACVPPGILNIDITSPFSDNITVDEGNSFIVNATVTCLNNNCGDVNVTLDPEGSCLGNVSGWYTTYDNGDGTCTTVIQPDSSHINDTFTSAESSWNKDNSNLQFLQFRVWGDTSYYLTKIYFKFDLPGPMHNISEARLWLDYYQGAGTDNTIRVVAKQIDSEWDEHTIRWNNQPNGIADISDTVDITGWNGGWEKWTFNNLGRELIENWSQNLTPNHGFRLDVLTHSGGGPWRRSYSSEAGSSYRPKLEITYSKYAPGKGTISEGFGSPFYTTSDNPATCSDLGCLSNMDVNDSCSVSWTVFANETGGTYEFYAFAESETAPRNESRHFNVTVKPTCCNLTSMVGCDNVIRINNSYGEYDYYINGDTKLCLGEYHYTGNSEFIIMNCTNCTLDCAGAHLIGNNKKGYGIRYSQICEYNYTGPTLYQTIKNCEVSGFKNGISELGRPVSVPAGTTCYLPEIVIDSVYSHDNIVGLHGPSTSLKDKVHIIKSSFKNNCFVDVEDWNCRLGNNLTLTGSNDLPILILRDTTINLSDNTYTEVLLCNVTGTINSISLKGLNYNNMLNIDSSKDLVISNLNVTQSNGVVVYLTNDSIIQDSEFKDNAFGLVIDRGVNISILNNTVINNSASPPCADEVYGVGVYLYRTNSSLVEDNSILNNRYFGVLLYDNSMNNTIRDNVICGNGWDQSPSQSVPEGDITEVSSTNNTFQDNKCDVSNPSGYCYYSCREQNCTNGIDDDNDGLIDCDDPDCYGRPECQGTLILDLVEPTSDITIPSGSLFEVRMNVSCHTHNCGDVNVTLDPPGLYDDWNYKMNITIDHDKVDSDLTDFPILIKLNSSNFDFSKTQSNGEDIRFTDSTETQSLSYEIESWNQTSEQAYVWVKVPLISSSQDTMIYMYYDNPNAQDAQNANDVWSNHYITVYHMNSVENDKIKDSSPYNNDGIVHGNTYTTSSFIDNGLYFDGSSDYVRISSMLGEFDEYEGTIELYANFDGSQNTYSAPWGIRQSGKLFEFTRTGGGTYMYYRYPHPCNSMSGFSYTPNAWQYWSFTWSNSGNFGKVYRDTKIVKSGGFSSSCLMNLSEDFFIGATDLAGYFYYRGYIDEFRVSDIPRTSAWIKTSYYSEHNKLLSFGQEQQNQHGKGIIPESPQPNKPFYTLSHNPATADNTPCLNNMQKKDSCIISWTVVDVNDTTTEFFATGIGENAPENESQHFNVTVNSSSVNTDSPVMQNVSISPSSPTENDNLTCSARASDNDSSILTYYYEWYLNDNHNSKYDNTETCSSGVNCTSSVIIPSSAMSEGDEWTCKVHAFDGSHYSDWMNDTVKIAPIFYPENCTNGIDDDGDGLIDCNDPDCKDNPICIPSPPPKPELSFILNSTCVNQSVKITVIDEDDNPVENAKININGSRIGTTDENGEITYRFTRIGMYSIKVLHDDYKIYSENINIISCAPSCECSVDAECADNESCDGCHCNPLECGEGYMIINHKCELIPNYCSSDIGCGHCEQCINHTCSRVSWYECDSESECGDMQLCINCTCVNISVNISGNVSGNVSTNEIENEIVRYISDIDTLSVAIERQWDKGVITDEEYHKYSQELEDARKALSQGKLESAGIIIQKLKYEVLPEHRRVENLIWLSVILLFLLFVFLLYKRHKKKEYKKEKDKGNKIVANQSKKTKKQRKKRKRKKH